MSIADNLTTCTIPGTDKPIKAGDCVVVIPQRNLRVARVVSIQRDTEKTLVHVRFYFPPEETLAGRMVFHGMKELFLSDLYATLESDFIIDVCYVHSVESYSNLVVVRDNDYFSRYGYIVWNGGFTPALVEVYCKCNLPWNPDRLMIRCDSCQDWYHPDCLGLTIEEINQIQSSFSCPDCLSSDVTEE